MQHTSNSNTDITSTRKRIKLMELIFAWKIFEEFFLNSIVCVFGSKFQIKPLKVCLATRDLHVR